MERLHVKALFYEAARLKGAFAFQVSQWAEKKGPNIRLMMQEQILSVFLGIPLLTLNRVREENALIQATPVSGENWAVTVRKMDEKHRELSPVDQYMSLLFKVAGKLSLNEEIFSKEIQTLEQVWSELPKGTKEELKGKGFDWLTVMNTRQGL